MYKAERQEKASILDENLWFCTAPFPVVSSRIKIFIYTLFWKAIWKLLEDRKKTDVKKEEKQSLLEIILQIIACYQVEWSYYLLGVLVKCSWTGLH